MQNKWDKARQFLLSDQQSVPASSYWDTLCKDEGIGRLVARRWVLAESDRQTLRALITHATGTDPCLSSLPQDRMAQARDAADEKLAREPVFSKWMLVAKRDNAIRMLHGGLGATPPGTCLAVPPQQLDLSAETQIIVVENGSAIQHWHDIQVPEDWRYALWCYRGHGSNAASLKKLLKGCPHASVAWYCDLDPAGLVMSMHEHTLMMVPEPAATQSFTRDFLQKHSKLQTFLAQQKLAMPITSAKERTRLWEYIQAQQIALTQETMITVGLPLIVM